MCANKMFYVVTQKWRTKNKEKSMIKFTVSYFQNVYLFELCTLGTKNQSIANSWVWISAFVFLASLENNLNTASLLYILVMQYRLLFCDYFKRFKPVFISSRSLPDGPRIARLDCLETSLDTCLLGGSSSNAQIMYNK